MKKLLQEVIKTSGDIWRKGWSERNAGNISIRLKGDEKLPHLHNNSDWMTLNVPKRELAGDRFIVSGTGFYLRNIELDPEAYMCMIELNDEGTAYKQIWGFRNGGKPTSELPTHLAVHALRKKLTDGVDRVVMHVHPTNLIALTYALDLDTIKLTRLLWEMHTECMVVFPDGCGFVTWEMPGGEELAQASATAMSKHRMVLWEYHGAMATGSTLDETFGMFDTAEKAAEIYLKVAALGPVTRKLGVDRIRALAEFFELKPNLEILQ